MHDFIHTGRIILNVTALMLVLAACGSHKGVEEFQLYARLFDEVEKASDPIIDRVKVAERAQGRLNIQNNKETNGVTAQIPLDLDSEIAPFHPDHAVYFADGADPPFAGALRGAIDTVDNYNRTLLAYADGSSLDAAKAQVGMLQSQVTGLITLVTGSPIGPAITVPLEIIKEASGLALDAGSREAFRKQLDATGGAVSTLLDEMRNQTPTMFDNMIAIDLKAVREAQFLGGKVNQRTSTQKTALAKKIEPHRNRIEATRKILAEWVVMLDYARIALTHARASLNEDAGSLGRISEAATLIGDVRVRAENIRLILAGEP